MKNKYHCLLIPFLLITTSSLKSAYWTPKKKMPYEIESIVRSIQWDYLEVDLKKNFQASVGKIDFMMNKFPKDELYFISKTTTYKYLLGNRPLSKIPSNFYETNPFLNFKLQKGEVELIPFGEWFISVILRDLNEIYQMPGYKNYLKSRKDPNFITSETNKIAKRLNLIVPWFIFFQERNIREINWDLQPTLNKILSQLSNQLKIYWELKTGDKITWPQNFEITWFEYQEKKAKPEKDTLPEIIDNIVKSRQPKELPSPTDDWKINTPDFASTLTPILKDQRPDPNYTPPEKLPQPVDDWIFE